MPPHMAPLFGIATGTPDYLKAKVGEQVSRTLPSMNLCPSSSSGFLNTGQAFSNLTVPPLLILSQRLSTASTPTTLPASPPGPTIQVVNTLLLSYLSPVLAGLPRRRGRPPFQFQGSH